jgi:hypothetical protein
LREIAVLSKDKANAIADALVKPGVERRKKSRVRFPELQAFPIEQRDDVLRVAMRAAWNGWQIPAVVGALVAFGTLAVSVLLIHPSLAVSLICATSFASIGVARFKDARTRKQLQLVQPGDRTSR